MKIKEIKCGSILNKSNLCDYCINPYIGCENKCSYCYADFMKKYTNHKENWGDFVDIKFNAIEILKKQISKATRGRVFISSVTDPYQNSEEKYKLTRNILEILLQHQFPVSILTKSILVLRDIDLIKKFKDIEVGFTICLNDKDAKFFEPNANLPSLRIEALKELNKNKIKTYIFLGPILPYISDPINIIKETYKFTNYYYIDKLNLKKNTWIKIEKVLKIYNKELINKYKEIFFNNNNNYYNDIKNEIKNFKNLNYKFLF